MAELVVTAIGADQPGIVAAVSAVLAEHDGNVEDSAMTILGGHFAIVLLVEAEDDPTQLEAALTDATAQLELTVHVTAARGGRESADPTHLLSVYGPDRTGILAGVTAALAEAGANITDLETRLLSAEDDPVYAMVIELVAPDGGQAIEEAIADTCTQLGVDHTLRRLDTEYL